jgi:acyl carrier protein
MEDLATKIQAEIANLAFKKVETTDSLIRSKLLDSISLIDLIMFIEEETGKQIPQHLIVEENFDTVEAILKTIEKIP